MVKPKKELSPRACECLSAPEGIALPASPSPPSHLCSVSAGSDFWEDTWYYICPLTGIVWRTKYTEDMRNCPTVYIRTGCRQLPLDTYTIAKGVVQLYSEPIYPPPEAPRVNYQLPRGVTPPPFPQLPLKGLFFETFRPHAEVMWACGDVAVRGRVSLKIWLRLLIPSSPGGNGGVLASVAVGSD